MDFPSYPDQPELRSKRRRRQVYSSMRIVHMEEVVKRTGVHRSTIYRWMEQGRFPSKDAPKSQPTGWLEDTYERWLNGKT